MQVSEARSCVLIALAAGLLFAGAAFAQHASRAPTAEVDQSPRSPEDLDWAPRPIHLNDSRLAGGPSDSLPENRVPLPSLCEMDPDHPSCDDQTGGGGGGGGLPDSGFLTAASCSFALSEEIGFTQMMTVTNGPLFANCAQNGMYSNSPSGGRWINASAVFYLPSDRSGSITWHGACAGQTGTSCTTAPITVDVASSNSYAHWEASATVDLKGRTATISFSATLAACGVVGALDCQ